jgi:hypothetical protein
MRSKLRKFVKILAEQANDKLTDDNVEYYIEQYNKSGKIKTTHGSKSPKKAKTVQKKIIKPKPPVEVVKEVETRPLIDEMTYVELRKLAKELGMKRIGRTGKMKLIGLIKKEYDSRSV